jgi:8-oxo-dGTP diphosphatase
VTDTETPEITRVTAAILINDEKIIIAKRKSTGKLPNKWEFPGGKVENNETPEQCLRREMKEEFDIDVSVAEYLGSSIYHYDHISIELLAYRTYWEGGNISLKDHDEYLWVPFNKLQEFNLAPADIPIAEKVAKLFR